MWLISNVKIEKQNSGFKYLQIGDYTFITDEMTPVRGQDGALWFYEGYILNRDGLKSKYSSMSAEQLPGTLSAEFGDKFINQIKGNFILIQLHHNAFKVFSDRFGIKKFFYWQNENEFVISNNLKALSRLVMLKLSSFGMSVYALTYHFTGGLTAFENVYHNQPAEYISLKDGLLKSKTYWEPEDLLNIDLKPVSIKEISGCLKTATLSTMQPLEPVSLSLTGGADTRNLLSIFLSMAVHPHLYTYGNPHSNDCRHDQ